MSENTKQVDPSLIMSFDVPDLRTEFNDPYAFRDEPELAEWWSKRSDEEIALLGHFILNGDYIWNVWREELFDAMKLVKANLESEGK